MVWQDYAITVIIILLSYALIPQIIKGFKEKKELVNLQTSLITSIGLYGLAIANLTLKLYLSATIVEITAILWTTLLIQRILYK